jgi:hypothetical protein
MCNLQLVAPFITIIPQGAPLVVLPVHFVRLGLWMVQYPDSLLTKGLLQVVPVLLVPLQGVFSYAAAVVMQSKMTMFIIVFFMMFVFVKLKK